MDKINELNIGKGYFQLKLKDSDLKSIRKLVNDHYLKNINKNYPNLKKYHQIKKFQNIIKFQNILITKKIGQ